MGIAVAVAVVAAAFVVSEAAGAAAWWTDAGGFVLLALLVVAFAAAVFSPLSACLNLVSALGPGRGRPSPGLDWAAT
jgi:hypothetical protein